MKVIAEQAFDLSFSDEKVRARLYEPVLEQDGCTWSCRIELDERFGGPPKAYGGNSLQALELGLKVLSIILYSSTVYRRRELGWNGQFGGDLGLPAMEVFIGAAPYPF